MSKKKKIQAYLNQKDDDQITDFEILLLDFIHKEIKNNLKNIGLSKISVHIDWHDMIKIVAIQAKYQEYFIGIQVDQEEISVSYDLDEADEDICFNVQTRKNNFDFYQFINEQLLKI